jgi:hypothetical protein
MSRQEHWSELPYELEKVVVSNPDLFSDPHAWRRSMMRAERAVCRIEAPEGRAIGTGFLIGPELVLTNDHVRAEFHNRPESVALRFGFAETLGETVGGCHLYRLDSVNWHVASSTPDLLDYCILRLGEEAGRHAIGIEKISPLRGWIELIRQSVSDDQALFVLQHPYGETLKFANGGLCRLSGHWLEYRVNTNPGSSGSPVFNNRWQCVGLHSRAGRSVNRGVQISSILDALPPSVLEELESQVTPESFDVPGQATSVHLASGQRGVPIDVQVLTQEEIKLIANAVVKMAKQTAQLGTNGSETIQLGMGKRVFVELNPDALSDFNMIRAIRGDIEVVQAREGRLHRFKQFEAEGSQPGMALNVMIPEEEQKLVDNYRCLLDRISVVLNQVRLTRNE